MAWRMRSLSCASRISISARSSCIAFVSSCLPSTRSAYTVMCSSHLSCCSASRWPASFSIAWMRCRFSSSFFRCSFTHTACSRSCISKTAADRIAASCCARVILVSRSSISFARVITTSPSLALRLMWSLFCSLSTCRWYSSALAALVFHSLSAWCISKSRSSHLATRRRSASCRRISIASDRGASRIFSRRSAAASTLAAFSSWYLRRASWRCCTRRARSMARSFASFCLASTMDSRNCFSLATRACISLDRACMSSTAFI
mmetsp:Transcript_29234/g.94222  ORF Transcript_29234/g.94222 Transcript_29234/m.94222 type:complete len:262 (+) Transcript_29234:300-1085(+)